MEYSTYLHGSGVRILIIIDGVFFVENILLRRCRNLLSLDRYLLEEECNKSPMISSLFKEDQRVLRTHFEEGKKKAIANEKDKQGK